MKICMAAKVDGIIIEPDGSREVEMLINKATKFGMPVVTVIMMHRIQKESLL